MVTTSESESITVDLPIGTNPGSPPDEEEAHGPV